MLKALIENDKSFLCTSQMMSSIWSQSVMLKEERKKSYQLEKRKMKTPFVKLFFILVLVPASPDELNTMMLDIIVCVVL
jgi:hypothetical protein